MDVTSLYLALLENPSAPRHYRALKECYESKNMHHEADAFTFLMQERFNILPDWGWKPHHGINAENICPDTCPEQRKDD